MKNGLNPILRGLLASSMLLGAVACSPVLAPHVPATSDRSPAKSLKTHRINFKINFSTGDFQTKQTAQANFVKLVITNGTETVIPNNGDAEGYVASSGGSTSVGVDVPNGSYWVATSGMYTNKSATGLIGDEVKSVFHVPGGGSSVDMNMSTLLSAGIIENLRDFDAGWLTANTPSLTDYKAFADSLTGMSVSGGNFSFSRLAPTLIDPRAVAIKIKQGTIATVTGAEGGIQNPQDYKKTPYIEGAYTAVSGSSGIFSPAVIDDGAGTVFVADSSSKESVSYNGGAKTFSSIYALTQTPTQLNQLWKVDFPNHHSLSSRYMAVGMSTNRVYGIVKNTTVTPNTFYLKAWSTLNGTGAWTFNLPNDSGLTEAGRFAPVAWRNRNGSACTCGWDSERVFVGYNSDSSGTRGIYAINDGGTQAWFYAAPNGQRIWSAGALSKDSTIAPFGAKLYVIAQQDAGGNKAKLIALDTIDGTATWTLDLGVNIYSGSSPVIGTDGTIYVLTNDSGLGYLEAINPDGTRKWATPYSLGALPYTGSPVVGRQNGKDVIYVPTADAKLHAIYDDKTAKWPTPMAFLQNLGFHPVIGAEPDGSHVIYLGQSETGFVMAIRDRGTTGKLIWQFLPGAFLSSGFALRDGKLLAAGFGGGDGQDVRMSAIKVFSPGIPTDAPWPMAGATMGRAGRKTP